MPGSDPDPRPIGLEEFSERLKALCLRSGGTGLPRRRRDRYILLRSAVQRFDAAREYSEPEIDASLRDWIAWVGGRLEIDPVALRRYLVDEGFLQRDRRGSRYRACHAGRGVFSFAAEVDAADPLAILTEARQESEARKQQRIRPRANG